MPSVSASEQSLLLPFDNGTGKATGLALANTGNSSAAVNFTFRNEDGSTFYTGNLSLSAEAKTEFSLSDRFPQTLGHRGTVVMSTASQVLTALGLRFLPGGTFTSLPVYPTGPNTAPLSRQVLSHVIDGGGWLLLGEEAPQGPSILQHRAER